MNTLRFDERIPRDIELYAEMIASLQQYGAKFETSREGSYLTITVK